MESSEYTLEFLPDALNDMTEIVSSFLMFDCKDGAVRIRSKMLKAAQRILHFPYSGVTVPSPKLARMGFRMVVVEKYLMFYKVFEPEKKIIFYCVLNGKTAYPTLMSGMRD